MKPLAPNTMIQNRYLVVHLIGKGGMGEVYLAVDQRLGSAVALKRTSFADDQGLAAAFEREAKILARLRHPVLPKVSDHFTENGDQFLVMEHISGDDLSKRLETSQKPFPVSWVMFWADQLLDALSYLHSHEPPIIHRDIKPQNLKLTDENHIILLDFGLSKDTSALSVVSRPGNSGSIVGYTPHFAPMEQIRGTGTNARSDIYSLSATLYQLMTNVIPPDALSRADAMLAGSPDPIVPLSDANPEISPAVSNVILKGLEVSQDKRFATAMEMQRSLRSAYAQMQNAMSANTVVFNANDPSASEIHGTTPPADESTAKPPETSPAAATPTPIVAAEQPISMEATVRMDAADAANIVKQADVKTEVFLAGDSAFANAVSESSQTNAPGPVTEDYSDGKIASEVPVERHDPTPASPFADIDGSHPAKSDEPSTPDFFTAADIPVGATVGQTSAEPVSSPEPHGQQPETPANAQDQAVQQQAPPPKKKSKAGLVIGGLAALLILGVGVLAGGYFAYTKYFSGKNVKPTPSASSSPTPASSPSATPASNVSGSDSNSNSNTGNDVQTVSPTPTPGATVPTKTPQTTQPTPGATPKVTPTKPPATPVTRPSTKPTPKSNRTIIDQ